MGSEAAFQLRRPVRHLLRHSFALFQLRRSLMIARSLRSAALVAVALIVSPLPARAAGDDGVIKFKSAYDMAGTIKRLKKDVADKGIMFFDEIDQSKLAADAGVTLLSSTLLCLAIRHSARCSLPQIQMPASCCSSIRTRKEIVWVAYTDFAWIMHRHGITNRDKEFKMASDVIASITSTVKPQ
jgi:hypothetical protein